MATMTPTEALKATINAASQLQLAGAWRTHEAACNWQLSRRLPTMADVRKIVMATLGASGWLKLPSEVRAALAQPGVHDGQRRHSEFPRETITVRTGDHGLWRIEHEGTVIDEVAYDAEFIIATWPVVSE